MAKLNVSKDVILMLIVLVAWIGLLHCCIESDVDFEWNDEHGEMGDDVAWNHLNTI